MEKEMAWCPVCAKYVEPEGQLNAQGLCSICPYCGEELKEDRKYSEEELEECVR